MSNLKNSIIDTVIPARDRDLGGFFVHRILPYATHRMVGPFIFFDHMGPAAFQMGDGMDVRPHPHMNLATVTYLFEGCVRHQDSLGSDQLIEPGAINWMIAGKGIVHSERTPKDERAHECKLNGIQLWVALPLEFEECEPSFSHHPKNTLPEFSIGDAKVKLLLGKAFGFVSPVPVQSDLFYAEVKMKKGDVVTFSIENREAAVYVVHGCVQVEDRENKSLEMLVLKSTDHFEVRALEDSHFMLIGGSPVGERFIFWNFVSSSKERIEDAKKDWQSGPQKTGTRFKQIPNDHQEYIPLPS